MMLLDAIFRFSGLGMLILIALMASKHLRSWSGAPFLLLSAISLSALFLGYTPQSLRLPDPFHTMFRFLDVPHLIFVWLFVLTLFSTMTRNSKFYGLIGIIYCLPIFWFRVSDITTLNAPPNWVLILVSVFSATLMLHLVYKTMSGWPDDLVQERRKTRLYFLGLVFLTTMIAAITELYDFSQFGMDSKTVKILCLWPAVLFASIWLISLNLDQVNFDSIRRSAGGLTQRQERIVTKLESLMSEQKLYENNQLRVSDLAKQLGVTQHKLREIINQHLGYKNFSAYLNAQRIHAVKLVFADPKMRDIPILTIALNSGFNSLTTFNRVFKHEQGITPSEYRGQIS